MTTLTDAELFCLRYLSRRRLQATIQQASLAAEEVGANTRFVRPVNWARYPFHSLANGGLIRRTGGTNGRGADLYCITPAGRAELERREGEG